MPRTRPNIKRYFAATDASRWLWLIAVACLLAITLNAAAFRSAWLSDLGYLRLDALLNRSSRAGFLAQAGTPESWFQASEQPAGRAGFETAYGLGMTYLARARYVEAIDAFRMALVANPEYSGTHALIGDAYHGAGNDAAAVAEWRAGQALPLIISRGDEQGRAGDWRAAIGWYVLATQVDPGSTNAFWQLGLAYGSAGQPQAEVDALLKAVNLSPDNIQLRHVLGLAYMSQGALEAAAAQFERVLAAEPNEYYTNLYMASIELALGRLDAAEAYARKAIQLIPSDPRPHFALGSVYFDRAQWPAAIDELKAAAALVAPWNRQSSLPVSGSDEAGYNLLLAQAYQAAGQTRPAIAAYQTVLSLDPQNGTARAALNSLQGQAKP